MVVAVFRAGEAGAGRRVDEEEGGVGVEFEVEIVDGERVGDREVVVVVAWVGESEGFVVEVLVVVAVIVGLLGAARRTNC